jgi:hypothetical protein
MSKEGSMDSLRDRDEMTPKLDEIREAETHMNSYMAWDGEQSKA